jgi:hypothetical protein
MVSHDRKQQAKYYLVNTDSPFLDFLIQKALLRDKCVIGIITENLEFTNNQVHTVMVTVCPARNKFQFSIKVLSFLYYYNKNTK